MRDLSACACYKLITLLDRDAHECIERACNCSPSTKVASGEPEKLGPGDRVAYYEMPRGDAKDKQARKHYPQRLISRAIA